MTVPFTMLQSVVVCTFLLAAALSITSFCFVLFHFVSFRFISFYFMLCYFILCGRGEEAGEFNEQCKEIFCQAFFQK